MRRHAVMLAAGLSLLLGGAACPSTSVYRTADPVAKGAWQVGVAGDVGGLSDSEQGSRVPTGTLELSVRRGVAEELDLGVKLYTAGLEGNATWRLARGTWSVALAPYVAGLRTDENGATVRAIHVFAGTALIASRPLSVRWTLGVGPLLGAGWYWPETGGSARGAWLGSFVHMDRRVGARSHVTPEIGLYRVFAGDVPVRGGAVRAGVSWHWDL